MDELFGTRTVRTSSDTAAGLPAQTSDFSHVGRTSVNLDLDMLRGILSLHQNGFNFRVTAIAGGRHGATSRRYLGNAFDVDTINGARVNTSNPFNQAFKDACRAYEATEVLGPGGRRPCHAHPLRVASVVARTSGRRRAAAHG
ncbi:hypothetical protein ACQEVC_43130 [Plantactinospora sp. CA-294935]|uniref:hypothetical protein n=1 Tax=Plantactinospora sp. CA-294935 TaxID=3240012 RepID=UPI003D910BB5